MASASLLKSSSVVLGKSEFVKGSQNLRQPSIAAVRLPAAATASSLTVRASYADELVKTAVSIVSIKLIMPIAVS